MKPRLLVFFYLSVLLVFTTALMAADATGKWTGTLTKGASSSDENREHPAYLLLSQQGTTLTGSAGPDANEQHPIQNGKVENGKITFEIPAGSNLMKFVLTQNGDEIQGDLIENPDGGTLVSRVAVKRSNGEALEDLSPKELTAKIAALDGGLFGAYNDCDLPKFASFIPEELEFYHDKAGVTTTRKGLLEAMQANICGKVRRELVADTLEVYPVPGYGAIETGTHRFYNKAEKGFGTGKFLHLWQYKNGEWKVTRVFSYAHISNAQ